jgi:TRAP-type transport system periplasmic protein
MQVPFARRLGESAISACCPAIVLLAVLSMLSHGGCSREGEIITVKAGVSHGPSHSFTRALEYFAEELEKESNGRFRVRVYSAAQLGGEKEMQEMLAVGSLEISVTGVLNTYEPLFSVFELPYLYRDRDHVLKVNQGPIVKEVAASLIPNGLRLLGFYENGFRNITNSLRPLQEPADVAGLMIRTPENPAQIETFRALKAIPTPLSYSELYTALVQGVVDGQENPLQNIWSGRLYEAQKHVAMTHHIYNSAYVLAGERFWKTLTAEDQSLFESCLNRSSRWQLALMEELDAELEAKLKEKGLAFTYPDRPAFEEATMPAYEALYRRLGPKAKEIVEKVKSAD